MNTKNELGNVIWRIVENKLPPYKQQRLAQAILDAGFVKFRNTDLMSVKIEEDKIIITITPNPEEF